MRASDRYDNIGQLKTARGKESGGTTNRLHEQLGYNYDAAGNLATRTNNTLIQHLHLHAACLKSEISDHYIT